MKCRVVKDPNPERYVAIFCPGCEEPHLFPTAGSRGWEWNESTEKPTFKPSILVNGGGPNHHVKLFPVCHSYVTDGKIQFLSDSTHALSGQTVELPEVDEKWG